MENKTQENTAGQEIKKPMRRQELTEKNEDVRKQRYDRETIRKMYVCGFTSLDISESEVPGVQGISKMNAYITLYRDGTFDKFKLVHAKNRKKMKKLMRDTAISYMYDLDFNADMVEEVK